MLLEEIEMTTFNLYDMEKTEMNLEGRYQGSPCDSPLLPESYEEIKQLSWRILTVRKIRLRRFTAAP